MALTIKNLWELQLTATQTSFGSVTAGKAVIVKTIHLVNTDTSARTVSLYYAKSGGGTRRLTPVNT